MRMQKSLSLFFVASFAAAALSALTPRPADPQPGPIAIVGATAHLGNGEVIESAVVAFAEGRITAVHDLSQGDFDTTGHDVIDAQGSHVYPGFVLPDSDLGLQEIGSLPDTIDHEERGDLNASVRALVAYNTDSEILPTTRFNGILVAQVSPNGGLVSGRSSIVQLDAWGWEDAALVADDGVHVHWPSRKKREFDFATFRVRYVDNEDHDDQVQRVEGLFRDAEAYRKLADPAPRNLKLEALAGLFDGTARLYLHARAADEIVLGVRFAQEIGIGKVVVVTQEAALDALDFLRNNEIPVIVSGVHRTPSLSHDDIDLPSRLPSLLVEAGLRVGLTYPSLMNARNLPFSAGTAAAYGLGREEAVRMITLTNAEILGIDDRVGSLEVGKDATLFVSKGDALDMRGNRLEAAFVEGRRIELHGMQQELYERYHDRYATE